ncbi:MAG: menaquinone biosynthesis protein [Aquificaceae bacterium]
MVKVGRVNYLNTLPLFYRWDSKVSFVEGHPSHLVKLLRGGEIQAGIVSSVEYLINREDYILVPGVSISSKERACSVLIFSERPLEEVESIYLTPASLTSRLLALYILEKVYRKKPEVVENKGKAQALLLIGDEAIKEKLANRWPHIYDLGEEWFKLHRLPFVFALFLVRKDAAPWLAEYIREQCNNSRAEFYKDLSEGKIQVKGLSKNFLLEYFNSCLSYELREREWASLEIFNEFFIEVGVK